MLFGGAGQVGPPGDGRRPPPDDLLAPGESGGEDLVLQIAMQQSRALHELKHALRFGDGAGERLLAGDADEARSTLHCIDDLLHHGDAGVVRRADPQGIDRGVSRHLGDASEHLRRSHAELLRQGGGGLGVLSCRARHPRHVRVAHAYEAPNMELGDKAGANETDTQTFLRHAQPPSTSLWSL